MAMYDPRKKKKAAGSNWVGGNSTWVGRNNKIIAPKVGTKEKVGDDVSKHRKPKTTAKSPGGGQGGKKSRYSSGTKNRKSLLSGLFKKSTHKKIGRNKSRK